MNVGEFKNNGDLFAYGYSGDLYAKGKFDVDGVVFTMEYTSENSGNKYKFKGDYDESIHKITETWGFSPAILTGVFRNDKAVIFLFFFITIRIKKAASRKPLFIFWNSFNLLFLVNYLVCLPCDSFSYL
jgi:hypothetical protein